MLNAVITWSLRHRLLVILAAIGLSLAGLLAFHRLPIDAFEEAAAPPGSVAAPGAAGTPPRAAAALSPAAE